jgi:hypothetical protein
LIVFPSPPTRESVISTEAVHSLTANRAVERPPHFAFAVDRFSFPTHPRKRHLDRSGSQPHREPRSEETPASRFHFLPQNKSQKVGASFNAKLVTAKTPQPPHISPQMDHQNTKFTHPFLQKPK